MDSNVPTSLTYGEFNQRRASLLSDIHGAKRHLKRIIDPEYTKLTEDAVKIVEDHIASLNLQLKLLVSTWEAQQKRKGVST